MSQVAWGRKVGPTAGKVSRASSGGVSLKIRRRRNSNIFQWWCHFWLQRCKTKILRCFQATSSNNSCHKHCRQRTLVAAALKLLHASLASQPAVMCKDSQLFIEEVKVALQVWRIANLFTFLNPLDIFGCRCSVHQCRSSVNPSSHSLQANANFMACFQLLSLGCFALRCFG